MKRNKLLSSDGISYDYWLRDADSEDDLIRDGYVGFDSSFDTARNYWEFSISINFMV